MQSYQQLTRPERLTFHNPSDGTYRIRVLRELMGQLL
jgi:hypothetical protein